MAHDSARWVCGQRRQKGIASSRKAMPKGAEQLVKGENEEKSHEHVRFVCSNKEHLHKGNIKRQRLRQITGTITWKPPKNEVGRCFTFLRGWFQGNHEKQLQLSGPHSFDKPRCKRGCLAHFAGRQIPMWAAHTKGRRLVRLRLGKFGGHLILGFSRSRRPLPTGRVPLGFLRTAPRTKSQETSPPKKNKKGHHRRAAELPPLLVLCTAISRVMGLGSPSNPLNNLWVCLIVIGHIVWHTTPWISEGISECLNFERKNCFGNPL